jgi:Fe2+ transport system protein FeoA
MKTTMDGLFPGESAIISRISGTGPIKRRIMDMGLVAGTIIRVQKLAPLGDPMEIKVKGFNLSLRKTEAAMIEVTPLEATTI